MAKWLVETRATVTRQYHVEDDNAKEAESKSCAMRPEHEEEESEETMAISEITD